jgi:hypothetical protein
MDGTTVEIQNAKVGDKVLDKLGHIQTVERWWCSGNPEELMEIMLWGGVKLYSTTNHNHHVFKMPRECPTGCGLQHFHNKRYGAQHFGGVGTNQVTMPKQYFKIEKLPAGEIVQGDYLMMPRKFDEIETDVTPDRARLLGYYIAEGDAAGGNGIQFTFGSHELDTLVKDTVAILSSEFNVAAGMSDRRTHARPANAITIRSSTTSARAAAEWFIRHGGQYCYTKRLSADVMRWPLVLKEELVRGMYRGDGSQFYVKTEKDGYVSYRFDCTYTTTSKQLASQLQLVLAQLGIFAKIKHKKAKKRETGINESDCYVLISRADHGGRLADLVWGEDSLFKSDSSAPTESHYLVDADYIYIEVKSAKVVQNDQPVYNLTVSGDHSYLVYNVGTYNSPDRQQYPVHRILANRYWRLFYKMDPVIGNCIDMYGDMPWSPFKLTGPGVEGSILNTMEATAQESGLMHTLPAMTKEFFITGEAIPHHFFDDAKGYWTYIALHNPDQLEVIDAPFIKMDPIMEFVPDDRLRSIMGSNHPALRKVRDQMPPQLQSLLQARQNIPLSNINATFIPRKLHPYDTRGTSIFSRLWRIFMYEDAIFNASIQTARRHAGPLKVAKLGNAQTGWIPGPEHEAKLLQLLAQAELDPHAWLVYHYGIAFETVGTTDRMMTINREWEIIERIKLVALGISKSFLTGEVTYASAATGLQVFLQRLKALRNFFEQKYIIPKFFLPLAEINGWIRRSPAEIQHQFRIKRSHQELLNEQRYIVPKIVWEKSLDPAIDQALVTAMQALENMGVKFSKTTKMATVGIAFEEEARKIAQEEQFERQFLPKLPSQQPPEGGGGGGGGVGGMSGGPEPMPAPGNEGDTSGAEQAGGGTAGPPGPTPEPAALKTQAGEGKKTDEVQSIESHEPGYAENTKLLRSKIWRDNRYGNWDAEEAEDIIELLHTATTDSPFWTKLSKDPEFMAALKSEEPGAVWHEMEKYLTKCGYPDQDQDELYDILVAENVMPKRDLEHLQEIEKQMEAEFVGSDPNLLVGASTAATGNLSGDITERLMKARKANAKATKPKSKKRK